MSKKVALAALSAVVTMGLSANIVAKDNDGMTMQPHVIKGMEKCYGIAKAGKNDCGSSKLSCAAQSKIDGDKDGWLAVPKGTCDRIVGGSTKPS
ncbi:MAG: BufA1 family periplasmic bufferin-type metallophore [Gammaproteobacteria bacterium]